MFNPNTDTLVQSVQTERVRNVHGTAVAFVLTVLLQIIFQFED